MPLNKSLLTLSAAGLLLGLVSCSNQAASGGLDSGYDTSDPFGIPPEYGYDNIADYQPDITSDPSYGDAAYHEAIPSPAPAPATPKPTAPKPSSPKPKTPKTPAKTRAPKPAAAAKTHTVVRGDTLWGLSKKYGVSVEAIRKANNIPASRDTVVLGSKLTIPAR